MLEHFVNMEFFLGGKDAFFRYHEQSQQRSLGGWCSF